MKVFYTLVFILTVSVAAKAQTAKKMEHSAYFSDFYIMQVKPMQFEVSYKYPKNDRVLMRIRDQQQNIIFVEKKLVYKKYYKYFDLSSMQDGRYTFELTDGEETFVQSFDVSTKTERVATAL